MEEKEKRIRAITQLYYSNPKIQECLAAFAVGREVVPRYFEGFGKRPDTLHYPSDVMGLVLKGATSFHASEEIWNDPLQLHSDMIVGEMQELRKGWDLLIDIDSPFLDFSKIAAMLLLFELEKYGVRNYGIKFSGSKGLHIIVPQKAFPEIFDGQETKKMFPEWPKAICEFLMYSIKSEFNRKTYMISNIKALQLRRNKKKEELVNVVCPQCGESVHQDTWVTLRCEYCNNEIRQKKSAIVKKRILRCERCLSEMNISNEEEFFECLNCKISNIAKIEKSQSKNVKFTLDALQGGAVEMEKGLHEKDTGGFDLVLVAPRHLFRMPYSLHEKTALASIVLTREEIEAFSPRDADPLRVNIRAFVKDALKGEARQLLADALEWKKKTESEEERQEKNKRKEYHSEELLELTDVTDEMFPAPIKKLLRGGLQDGKKRGVFILITFLRACGFPREVVEIKISDWNKLNQPPLKAGYLKSQIDWHFRQKKKILPPNYENPSFYKDLGLLDKKPDVKNPLVDVMRSVRKRSR
ncbi:MAG: hypothetical protein AABY00_00175 [Nanoarchaeota archaeon]